MWKNSSHNLHTDHLLLPKCELVCCSDGDHPPNDHTNIREGGGDSKEAEEVQGMARNELKQSNSALGTSPGN